MNFLWLLKFKKKSRLTPERVSANVDFLGPILKSCSPADFEYWREKLPHLPKPIKAGLYKKSKSLFDGLLTPILGDCKNEEPKMVQNA